MRKSHFLGEKLSWALLSIEWNNPYTGPPDGQKKILWACCVPWPYDYDNYWKLYPDIVELGSGYGHHLNFYDIKSIKRWSSERKAKERLRRMERRINKKDPLFAKQFITQTINNNPDYYDPAAIQKEIDRKKIVMAKYKEDRIAKFIDDCITSE